MQHAPVPCAPISCAECRERVSARLDGEEGPSVEVDTHLDGCPGCRAFADRAAAVTRLARTGTAQPGPDLVAGVLDAARVLRPVVRRRRAGIAVRVGLGVVGVGQVALAVLGVLGAALTGHLGADDMQMAGASAAHFAHEAAAWNLAIGIGFAAVAMGRSRLVPGLVPVLGAFVGVLAVLSVLDLAGGRVDPGRLLGHGLMVLGLVLLLVHRRVLRDGGGRAAVAPSGTEPARSDPALPWIGPVTGPGAVAHADEPAAREAA